MRSSQNVFSFLCLATSMAVAGCGAAPDDGGGADPSETAESGGAAGAGVVNAAGSGGTAAGGETAGTTNPGTGGAAGNAGPRNRWQGRLGRNLGRRWELWRWWNSRITQRWWHRDLRRGLRQRGRRPSSTRQTPHPLGGNNTAPNGYYEYLPPGWSVSPRLRCSSSGTASAKTATAPAICKRCSLGARRRSSPPTSGTARDRSSCSRLSTCRPMVRSLQAAVVLRAQRSMPSLRGRSPLQR